MSGSVSLKSFSECLRRAGTLSLLSFAATAPHPEHSAADRSTWQNYTTDVMMRVAPVADVPGFFVLAILYVAPFFDVLGYRP